MTRSTPISRLVRKVAPILAIICGFVSLMVYLFFFEFVFSAKLYLGAACVFAGLWAFSSRDSIRRSFEKTFAAGVPSFVLDTASVVVIVALVFSIADNHKAVFDLTINRSFTLSPFSERVIEGLDRRIEIIGFVRGDDPRITMARDLLSQYDTASDRIDTRIIDPGASPAEAARYGRNVESRIMVRCGSRQEWSGSWREQSITGLIVRATSAVQPKVRFLTGHGERPISGGAPSGLSQAAQYLRFDGFDVTPLDVLSGRQVPTDASVVVAAAPIVDLLPPEVAAMRDYLASGGKMLLLVEPDGAATFSQLLEDIGLEVLSGEVIDPASNVFNDPCTPAVSRTGQLANPIAAGLPAVFFPGASPIKALKSRSTEVDLDGILVSSPASYMLSGDGRPGSEPILGPFYLSASVEAPAAFFEKPPRVAPPNSTAEKGEAPSLLSHPGVVEQLRRARRVVGEKRARLVVIADADFASNRFIDELGNRQLFTSSVKWLAESDDIASIPSKSRRSGRMVLTSLDLNVIKFVSIVLFPLLPLLAGGVVWWRRR